MKKLFSALAILPLVGAGCWGGSETQTSVDVYGNTPAAITNISENNEMDNTPSTILLEGNNALTVSKQKSGSAVTVDFIALEKPGFIVIHADNNGKPGAVLATSSLLGAGSHTNILLSLETQIGKTYFATLHIDNGDATFTEAADPHAKDAHDTDVTASFQVVGSVQVDTKIKVNTNMINSGLDLQFP